MARYSLTFEGITLAPAADTISLTDAGYPFFLQGGNGTMRLNISDIYVGGESVAAANTKLKLARDSTVGVTPTAGTTRSAALDASGQAPGTLAVLGNGATTDPQRSATLHLLALGFNAFGGAVRWVARQKEEISTVGNTASLGEVSLSAFTAGGGIVGGHCLFEIA